MFGILRLSYDQIINSKTDENSDPDWRDQTLLAPKISGLKVKPEDGNRKIKRNDEY